MLIIPNVTNDVQTPMQLASRLNDSFILKKLKKALPELKNDL